MTADDLMTISKMVEGDPWDRGRAHDLTGDRETAMLMERAYGGSLDAAKELHERLVPDEGWSISETGDASLWPPGSIDEQNAGVIEARCDDNPARAWLLAILDALIAEETRDAD